MKAPYTTSLPSEDSCGLLLKLFSYIYFPLCVTYDNFQKILCQADQKQNQKRIIIMLLMCTYNFIEKVKLFYKL
jgi:hypothetical protein